jgi:endonuclease/exonuclease/phosphatase family metal-dependent hydrolase
MKLLLLFFLLLSGQAQASLKVMNFNTMCDLCGDKKKYGPFKERLNSMADTINRHDPDLVSLQEFSNLRQVKKVVSQLKTKYSMIYHDGKITNFTDPVFLIRKDRFKILSIDGFWLGPNPRLPKSWKLSIPRRLQWVKLMDLQSQKEFILMGSHFDNNSANKVPSAKLVNQLIKDQKLPVLFAADTNIKTSHQGYSMLLGQELIDTFPGTEDVIFHANSGYDVHDACNKSKSPTFPDCRIDHVLTTPDFPMKAKSWAVDVYKYQGSLGFVSDHRAVIVDFE